MDEELHDSRPPAPTASAPEPDPPKADISRVTATAHVTKSASQGDMKGWMETSEAAMDGISGGEGMPDASGGDKETPS